MWRVAKGYRGLNNRRWRNEVTKRGREGGKKTRTIASPERRRRKGEGRKGESSRKKKEVKKEGGGGREDVQLENPFIFLGIQHCSYLLMLLNPLSFSL